MWYTYKDVYVQKPLTGWSGELYIKQGETFDGIQAGVFQG